MSLDENVVVVDYDPAWPGIFSLERRRICSTLGVSEADLEHIGSTAVPGLAGVEQHVVTKWTHKCSRRAT